MAVQLTLSPLSARSSLCPPPVQLTLSLLPADILRHMALTKILSLVDIFRMCSVSKHYHRIFWSDDKFWYQMGLVYLTEHPARLQSACEEKPLRQFMIDLASGKSDDLEEFLVNTCSTYGFEKAFNNHVDKKIGFDSDLWPELLVEFAEEGYLDLFMKYRECNTFYSDVGLSEAARGGHLPILKYILKRNVKRDMVDDDYVDEEDETSMRPGIKPRHLNEALGAAFRKPNNYSVVEYLWKRIPDEDRDNTGLMSSAVMTSLDYIHYLEQKGIHPTAQSLVYLLKKNERRQEGEIERIATYLFDELKMNATSLRIPYTRRQLIPLLTKYGATLSPKIAVEAARARDPEGLRMVLRHGADVHYDRESALRSVLSRDNQEVVKILLDAGADISACAVALQCAPVSMQNFVNEYLTQQGKSVPPPIPPRRLIEPPSITRSAPRTIVATAPITQCVGTTQAGHRCKRFAAGGHCYQH